MKSLIHIHTLLLIILCNSIVSYAYLITPQWQVENTPFYQSQKTKDNEFIAEYKRMGSDTIISFDLNAEGNYFFETYINWHNIHDNIYKSYPQYYQAANGEIKKAKEGIKNPIFGWVWGMSDESHYNAVLMRNSSSQFSIYDNDKFEICIISVNGNDTTYHVKWRNITHNSGFQAQNLIWIYGRNNTIWIGSSCNYSIPWSIVHNIPNYGSRMGIFLGTASKLCINNCIVSVSDIPDPKHTHWTKDLLDEHFSSHETDYIEGLWDVSLDQRNSEIKMGGDYKLAIVKNKQEEYYDIVYLDGAKLYPTQWKTGSIKGTLKANSMGFYDLSWFDAERHLIENQVAFINENGILLRFKDYNASILLTRIIERKNKQKPKTQQEYRTGSGFAISHDGYIATNNHVIDGCDSVYIYICDNSGQRQMKTDIVVQDSINDLAILRINDSQFNRFDEIPYIISNRTARKGEEVFYLGYPKPTYLNTEIKTSTGRITAINGYSTSEYMVSIDVDNGSSGSPMFDSDGNVIGVIVGGYNKNITRISANLAIKGSLLYNLIQSISTIEIPQENKIKELSHPDKIDAIAPYVFLIIAF